VHDPEIGESAQGTQTARGLRREVIVPWSTFYED
jgi:hypothetical protein